MTQALFYVLLSGLGAGPGPEAPPSVGDWATDHAACWPIPLRGVRLAGFLGERVAANNRRSLLAGLESPIPKAFEARAAGREPPESCIRLATDSDFYKWLEGASYAVASGSAPAELAAALRRYAELLVSLQEPDGYLGTRVSPARPFDERVCHDLYVAGHFIEAAVAHHRATGDGTLLSAAVRLADLYRRALDENHPYYRLIGQEHPEMELALVRLYRATGQKRFLDFAAKLTRMAELGPHLADVRAGGGRRHAVRLCYLLAACAELYLETGDEEFVRHLPSLWDEIVTTRMYVTGGIGYNEVIPERAFDLPQTLERSRNRDIAETCASVAMMMFTWRLHGVTGESRAYDVIENILYNHGLGAVSPDHLGIFYYNPLRRVGDLTGRTDHGGNPVRRTYLPHIHSTACCFPNAWRFFAQLPEYVLSVDREGILVNLYSDVTARGRLADGTAVTLEMETRYPHEGHVKLHITPEKTLRFTVGLRIPIWCEGATVNVAGQGPVSARPGRYHRVNREWRAGDEVILHLPMRPCAIFDPAVVEANRGQVVFRRGPLVYCLEKQDAAGLDLDRVSILLDEQGAPPAAVPEFRPDLGLYVLRVRATERPRESMPATGPAPTHQPRDVMLIPFFFRANRAEDTRWLTWIPYE